MFAWNKTIVVFGILGIFLVAGSGCSQKKLYVATGSAELGEEGKKETATPFSETLPDKVSPLPQGDLTEGSLEGEGMEGEEESAASLVEAESDSSGAEGSPLEQEPVHLAHGAVASDAASSSGQDIRTNTTSQDQHKPDIQAESGSTISNVRQPGGIGKEGDTPIEHSPENVIIAKAEPSEAIKHQVDRMKEEEVAAVTAGLQDVFFKFDSWSITPEGKQALESDVEWLKGEESAELLIEGHCDERGTQAYNMVLGEKRAVAIRSYLVELGIDHDKLSVISYGKDRPFCADPTEVCYQLNRRGHFLLQKP
jgi:peptidoglycan-associated lipoprotein